MRSFRAVLFFAYLTLSCLWLAINLHGASGRMLTYYCLALAVYFIVVPAYLTLVTLLSNAVLGFKILAVFISFGVLFFGLSFLSTFCDVLVSGINFHHKAPRIFYMLQYPFCILGLIEIWCEKNRGVAFIIFTLFVFLISYIFSQNLNFNFSFVNFYKFYLPIKSFVLLLISIFIFLKTKEKVSVLLILVGFLIWFFGDLTQILSENYPGLAGTGYSEFLYLSSIFLLILGVFGYINRRSGGALKNKDDVAFLREVPYQIPFSLNSSADR